MLLAVNFHYVRNSFDAPFPSIFGVTPHQFRHQLETLARCGTFVSGDDIAMAVAGGKALPERSIVITFDDGLTEQFALALPILDDMGIPALFFANSRPVLEGKVEAVHKFHILRSRLPQDAVERLLEKFMLSSGRVLQNDDLTKASNQYQYDTPRAALLKYALNTLLTQDEREAFADTSLAQIGFDEGPCSKDLYMDVDQLRALAKRGYLGTHGHRHVQMGLVGEDYAVAEIERSVTFFNSLSDVPLASLSYPSGTRQSLSEAARTKACSMGLSFAFTMERAVNQNLRAPMYLARFSNSDLPGDPRSKFAEEDLFEQLPQANWFH